MSNQSSVERLVDAALQQTSGPLYTAMQLLVQDVYKGYNQLFPADVVSFRAQAGGALDLQAPVTSFQVVVQPTNIHLSWNLVDNAARYEIRFNTDGLETWNTATFIVQTHSLQADISPFTIPLLYGDYTFLIEAIDDAGTYSIPVPFHVSIPHIQKPVITASIVGNNVLLKWTAPSSVLQIDHYNVYSNGVKIGEVKATFDVIFEQIGGNYSFTVEAVDILGNVGLPATDVTVTLRDPIDFAFLSSVNFALNGTFTNAVLDTDGTLFAPFTSKTYDHHFSDNTYATWQDPISAGYPLYFQPDENTIGTYVEVIDFGSVVNNTIVSLDYNTTRLVGTIGITATISVSTTSAVAGFDTPVAGTSRFATSVRWAKYTITVTAADNKSSINMFNLRGLLSVQREHDGGTVVVPNVTAVGPPATTKGQVHVAYTKNFSLIDSITITPVSAVNQYFVAYALDTPAIPLTGFTIYLYDTTGAAVGGTVSWDARGVIL